MYVVYNVIFLMNSRVWGYATSIIADTVTEDIVSWTCTVVSAFVLEHVSRGSAVYSGPIARRLLGLNDRD